MTSTVFVNGVTLTDEGWFNDGDTVIYDRFGNGTTYTGNLTVPGTTVLTGTLQGASGTLSIASGTNSTGTFLVLSGTGLSAGGTAGSGYMFSSVTNFGVFFGSGAPSLSAAKGSLYLRSDGSGTNDRMYVNTNGTTTWTAVVTVA